MTSSQIIFDVSEASSAYTPCSLASGLDCCSISRYDALSTHYYSLKSNGHGAQQVGLADVEAWTAFGPGVPFGASQAASALVFAYDLNADGMDDVVIGNRIYWSSFPTSATQSTQQSWDTTRHVGKQFTGLVPKLMDAVFVSALFKVFALIVYEDNSVVLYTLTPTAGVIPEFVFESRLDATGSRGTVTSISMFASTVQLDVQRVRIGMLLTYADADDIVHTHDVVLLESDVASGYVAAQDTALPLQASAVGRPRPDALLLRKPVADQDSTRRTVRAVAPRPRLSATPSRRRSTLMPARRATISIAMRSTPPTRCGSRSKRSTSAEPKRPPTFRRSTALRTRP